MLHDLLSGPGVKWGAGWGQTFDHVTDYVTRMENNIHDTKQISQPSLVLISQPSLVWPVCQILNDGPDDTADDGSPHWPVVWPVVF